MENSFKIKTDSSKIEKQNISKFKFDTNKNLEYMSVQKKEEDGFNKLPDKKEILQQNNQIMHASNPSNPELSKILFYLILLISNITLNYLIKPVGTLLDLIFLTNIVFLPEIPTEENGNSTQSINSFIRLIGWVIILILPSYHLFRIGIKIIGIHESIFSRIYAVIILFMEIIFNLPLTFLYECNLFSIYLFEEDKYKQLLNPWLVFYPTIYTESIFEIFRNFLHSGFFFVIAIMKYSKIKNTTINTFSLIILLIQIIFCVLRFLGNLVITIKKVKENLYKKNLKKKK